MRRAIVCSLAVALVCATAAAQTTTKPEQAPQLTAEQQQQLGQAVAAARDAQLQAEAAVARAEKAQAEVQAAAFRIMALLKASPEEWELKSVPGGGYALIRKAPKAVGTQK